MDVLYEDERIIVVDKPHFLATMPRGMWYRETALIQIARASGGAGYHTGPPFGSHDCGCTGLCA